MKRYWVKVTFEIREYDEKNQRVLPQGIFSEPATNLTPEPDVFIGQTMRETGEKLAKVLMDMSEPVENA